ncbi:MAG TPA: tRNA lysidine(34) synthetase TilS, partial [Rhizobiales bacterium]|nr:tRNA lysidine(34) synthetase TilS [Hyphomicrobiales bacterium]
MRAVLRWRNCRASFRGRPNPSRNAPPGSGIVPDARAGSDKPVTADEAATLFAPLAAYSHLALAVSGGCDSVALMWLLARWSKVYAPQISISVLSVDHGLRDGARAEAEQAGQWARDYGFSHHILNWRGEKPQAGVQAAARKARYELLAGWCRAHGAQLVLAHHLDDQAETVLMRLFRGSGIDGLCGMSRQSWREGVRLLRPLLEVPKARLVATLQHAGQGWCEDPSNQDLKYERVRIRRGLESLARAGFDPASISMSAAALRPVREALDAAADALIANAGVVSPGGFAHLEAEALAQVAGETGLRVFRRFLRFAGGNAHPPRRRKLLRLFEVMRHDLEASATLAGCRV